MQNKNQTLFSFFNDKFASDLHSISLRSLVITVREHIYFELYTNRDVYRWYLQDGVLVGIDGVQDVSLPADLYYPAEKNTKLVIDNAQNGELFSYGAQKICDLNVDLQSKITPADIKASAFILPETKVNIEPNLITINSNTILDLVYESNRIEGSKLTIDETRSTIQNIDEDYRNNLAKLEAKNLYLATEFVINEAQNGNELNMQTLRDLHSILLKDINNANNGLFRRGNVFIEGAKAKFPEPEFVDSLIEQMFVEYNALIGDDIHPIVRAAFLHSRFVGIHPFIDGNGRTARLLMNYELIKNGYQPVIISADNERSLYYEITDQVNLTGDFARIVNFVGSKLNVTVNVTLNSVVELIDQNSKITVDEMAEELNRNRRTILRWLKQLQEDGIVNRIGSDKNGSWEINK